MAGALAGVARRERDIPSEAALTDADPSGCKGLGHAKQEAKDVLRARRRDSQGWEKPCFASQLWEAV